MNLNAIWEIRKETGGMGNMHKTFMANNFKNEPQSDSCNFVFCVVSAISTFPFYLSILSVFIVNENERRECF